MKIIDVLNDILTKLGIDEDSVKATSNPEDFQLVSNLRPQLMKAKLTRTSYSGNVINTENNRVVLLEFSDVPIDGVLTNFTISLTCTSSVEPDITYNVAFNTSLTTTFDENGKIVYA